MQPAQPSRTALRVALRRAAHQVVDAAPLVFPDPFAVSILGSYAAGLTHIPTRPSSIALRAWLVARSRFAEDTLATASETRGVRQYLLLGAGLDTFALRNPFPHLKVFEVDHPSTQLWKRNLLADAALCPLRTTFVPVDFETQDLRAQLVEQDFDLRAPVQVSWLGVVPYLTRAAFRHTLHFLASLAPGSGVVFDYGLPRDRLPFQEQLEHDSLAARVALAGEPFQLFLSQDELRQEFRHFSAVDDLGRDDLNRRYFAGRFDHLAIRGTAGRLISAIV